MNLPALPGQVFQREVFQVFQPHRAGQFVFVREAPRDAVLSLFSGTEGMLYTVAVCDGPPGQFRDTLTDTDLPRSFLPEGAVPRGAPPCGLTIPVTMSVRTPVSGSRATTELGVALYAAPREKMFRVIACKGPCSEMSVRHLLIGCLSYRLSLMSAFNAPE